MNSVRGDRGIIRPPPAHAQGLLNLDSTPRPPSDLAAMQADAETVRAYLVELRGGAPFLSGADSRLLIAWLEAGVPVAIILSALDAAAERRRKRRGKGKPARSRLTLSACRSAIDKLSLAPTAPQSSGLSSWIAELRDMRVPPEMMEARRTIVEDIAAIRSTDPDTAAREAIEACRRFQATAWTLAKVEVEAIESAARIQLAALEKILDKAAFEAAVEEVVRDTIHARFPLVSAKVVWDRLTSGEKL